MDRVLIVPCVLSDFFKRVPLEEPYLAHIANKTTRVSTIRAERRAENGLES